VAQISLDWLFVGIIGAVILMVFTPRSQGLWDEWSEPLFITYLGALLGCLMVQPWVRRTLRFWFSLSISCAIQFLVSHRLTVYHPAQTRNGSKGIWFLSLFAGYVVGSAVFLLLQKLKSARVAESPQ
jgi:hypothetical protein